MTYFNFNFVTDPPNDELVNVEAQINDNWEDVETKLLPFNQKPSDFGAIVKPKGTEAFRPTPGFEHRISAWDGAEWRSSLAHSTSWGLWQTVLIRAPTVIRPNFPVVARVNAMLRKVEISGGVLFDGAASAWPTGTTVEITADTAIQTSFAPANAAKQAFQQVATGAITVANGFASAVAIVEQKAGPDRTAISVRYQGDAGGGNFIMLDGLGWYF